MHDRVWEYLGVMYDDATWPDTDPLSAIDEVWADRGQAMNQLIAGFALAEPAQDDAEVREQLSIESDAFPEVGLMASVPQVLLLVLSKGIKAIFVENLENILDKFESSSIKEKCIIAFFLAEQRIGSCKSRAGLMLIDILGEKTNPEMSDTRCQAARALGKVEDADEALVKLLSDLAADKGEIQSVRATCIEALMDLGPIARSSVTVLQQIKEEGENEDLQMFAWSALKSVTAETKEHPCGGTVAEHMRSLYGTRVSRDSSE